MIEKNLKTPSASLPPKHTVSNNWLKITLSAVLVLCIIGYYAQNIILGTPVATQVVVQTELRQTVVASGRVTWPQRVSVASEISGRVKSIPVQEGQEVQPGALLIQLDDDSELANLAQATAAVESAEAKLRQVNEVALPTAKEILQQTKADVEQASQQLNRIKQLSQLNYISDTELETAQRNLIVANSKLEAAQLQVQSNQPQGSDALLAMTTLNQARASMQVAQIKWSQTTVLATAKGTLISRSIEPGNMAAAGKELMELAVAGETLIEVLIDEKNLAKIALGQQALCSADAFPQQRFYAEITYINPSVDAIRGAVEVKLLVTKPPSYLRQDMTISVDIETAKKSAVLVIPSGTLHDPDTDMPWVLVVRNNRAVRQVLTLGLRGDDNVEVITGLTEGESVIPANFVLIKADQRVRTMSQ